MSGESTGAERIQVEHGTVEAPERSRNWKIYIMPFLIALCLVVVFYSIQNAINGLEEGVIQLQILFGFLDMLLAFFFGFFVFGFIGIVGAKLQFPIHRFFRRNKKLDRKYVMLRTKYHITSGTLLKRAFLVFAVSIFLTLTTIQFGEFMNIVQSPDTVVDFEDYFTGYEKLYSFLVFFFSFITSFIITPTWFFDDINLMFYRVEENVKFLYPYGRSVLPWLKGLGGPGVIISYILFIIVRIGIDIKFIIIIIDPLITFYIPIMFLIGYESISFGGKKILKRWLQKKGIEEFTDLELILTKQVGKSAQSSFKDQKRIQQDPARGKS